MPHPVPRRFFRLHDRRASVKLRRHVNQNKKQKVAGGVSIPHLPPAFLEDPRLCSLLLSHSSRSLSNPPIMDSNYFDTDFTTTNYSDQQADQQTDAIDLLDQSHSSHFSLFSSQKPEPLTLRNLYPQTELKANRVTYSPITLRNFDESDRKEERNRKIEMKEKEAQDYHKLKSKYNDIKSIVRQYRTPPEEEDQSIVHITEEQNYRQPEFEEKFTFYPRLEESKTPERSLTPRKDYGQIYEETRDLKPKNKEENLGDCRKKLSLNLEDVILKQIISGRGQGSIHIKSLPQINPNYNFLKYAQTSLESSNLNALHEILCLGNSDKRSLDGLNVAEIL